LSLREFTAWVSHTRPGAMIVRCPVRSRYHKPNMANLSTRFRVASSPQHSPTTPLSIAKLHGSPASGFRQASSSLPPCTDMYSRRKTSFHDADEDAWISGIESALNDFAREVDAGAWLSGIQRAKVSVKKHKEQAEAEAYRGDKKE
jgi:hypothetical protein